MYGGAPKGPQIGALARGKPSIVVATPGRINDILKLDAPPVTNLKSCEYLVRVTARARARVRVRIRVRPVTNLKGCEYLVYYYYFLILTPPLPPTLTPTLTLTLTPNT